MVEKMPADYFQWGKKAYEILNEAKAARIRGERKEKALRM